MGGLVAIAYFAVAVLSVRPLYGRMRARSIDNGVKQYPRLYAKPVEYFNQSDRPLFAFLSVVLSAFWPFGWAVLFGGPALMQYLDGTSIRSEHELKAERDRMASRIRDLERELGL